MSNEIRKKIIKSFINMDKKYSKPFETGEINTINIFGGDWNSYANLVLTSVMADSLNSIETKLEQMIELENQQLEINRQLLELLKNKQ